MPEGAPPPPQPRRTPAPEPVAAAPEPPPPSEEVVVEAPAPERVEETGLRRRPMIARTAPAPMPRRPGRSTFAWVAAAAVAVGLIGGLVMFRSEVARLAPATRPIFAKLGLPADPLGLVIEQVRADPAFQGGRPVLAVTGQIRNVAGAAAVAPSLRVNLLDKAGKPVAAKVARPIDGRVPAGAIRHFAIAIIDPPASVHDLQVTFEAAAPRDARPAPRAAEALLTGPAPVEAQPLPAGSPDALPQHD
jgi:hypothetical protein